jgi:hypothetical protein
VFISWDFNGLPLRLHSPIRPRLYIERSVILVIPIRCQINCCTTKHLPRVWRDNAIQLTYIITYGTRAHIWALSSSVLRFPDHTHTQTHSRTPLDRWSARSRGLYLHRTTQHIKTRDKYPCLQRDSNPRSRQPTGYRLTPYTARPPVSAN